MRASLKIDPDRAEPFTMVGEPEFLEARDRTRTSLLDRLRQDSGVDDPHDALDEIYTTAWANRHSYDPTLGTLDAWMHGIAKNVHLNHRRGHLRRRRAEVSSRERERERNPPGSRTE